MKRSLTIDALKSVLTYDQDTGIFYWLARSNWRASSRFAGKPAGSADRKGYLRICLFGKSYLAHHLAWFYMTGEWPKDQIDHEDLNKANNKWTNLREATNAQNKMNSPVRRDSRSGLKGIKWHTQALKWWARISVKGKRISLGLYDCPAAAHLAYVVEADKSFGKFARAS